jgi:hypothetical protein
LSVPELPPPSSPVSHAVFYGMVQGSLVTYPVQRASSGRQPGHLELDHSTLGIWGGHRGDRWITSLRSLSSNPLFVVLSQGGRPTCDPLQGNLLSRYPAAGDEAQRRTLRNYRLRVKADRASVRAIRVYGTVFTRVRVVWSDGRRDRVRFILRGSREPLRSALARYGWPAEERRWGW